MNKILNFAIVGCGTIANQKHMPNLQKQEQAQIIAFCDIDIEKAKNAAEKFGTPNAKVYTDYLEMLKDSPEIEVVHVCVPNAFHCEVTVAAFEADKHVLCEKPMAATAQQAQQMIDAWKKTNKKFTIGYQWRFRPEMLKLKEMCQAGELGDIYYAKATSIRRCAAPAYGDYLSLDKQGGGALIDSGSHSIDLTLWLMDNYELESVTGMAFHKLKDRPEGNLNGTWKPEEFLVEDSAVGQVKFKNGAVLAIEAAWMLNTFADVAHIPQLFGTKAGADFLDKYALTVHGMQNNEAYDEKIQIPGASPFLWRPGHLGIYEAEHWVKAILEDIEPEVSPYQALVVCKIIDAIYESSKTGKPISIK